MQIQDLMKLIDKYYAGADCRMTVCDHSPDPDGEGLRIGLYQTDCTFTVEEYPASKDCWYTHHFSAYGREGGAVYYFLNHPVYAEELKVHSFPEYRLLIHVNNKGLEIPYGVIMKLDGVWNAYLADKGHYYIKNWTFKSIDEAVDYFEGYVKSNEQLNDMAQRFINRNGQI